jgi:predicted nuclease of predicted toxin-antitoxin system
MKVISARILTDENISPKVVSFLRNKGFHVVDVKEMGLHGKDDAYLLKKAHKERLFVLTHDSDFGLLAINEGVPCYGIIYLRLKNMKPENVARIFEKLILSADVDLSEGVLIVVEETRIRIRKIESR